MRKNLRALRYWVCACAISIGLSLLVISLVSAGEFNRSQSDRAIQERATEAVIWAMPAVKTLLMYDQMRKAGGKAGQIVYWGEPLTWRNQTLTNPDTLYFMGFYDTKMDGPMVVEIPPAGADGSLNGNIVTLWQTSLEDAGLLGVDKGAGAKFVITPPGFADRIPDDVEEDRRGRVLDLGQREETSPWYARRVRKVLSVGNGPLDVDIAAAVQIGANQEVAGESIGSQPVKARKARCSHPTK